MTPETVAGGLFSIFTGAFLLVLTFRTFLTWMMRISGA